MSKKKEALPSAFKQRRLHSLMGIWIALYLIEHLFTNSQLGWIVGNSNNGFVRSVNRFGTLPYLPIIEIVLLGIPISYHMI